MSSARNFQVFTNAEGTGLVKAWIEGVQLEDKAREQIENVASMPFIHRWMAVMPDAHWGMGATIGSVIPTIGAVIPAAVGVDIGCGMTAVRTNLDCCDLPDDLSEVRAVIEQMVPHGRTCNGGPGDVGAWPHADEGHEPEHRAWHWQQILPGFLRVTTRHPEIAKSNNERHLGTLGTGNHFIEICLDQHGQVWIMLHSGSRGVGAKIGTYFIRKAKDACKRWYIELPDPNLAYLAQGSQLFSDYMMAVGWAQGFAKRNRAIMMMLVKRALSEVVNDSVRGDFTVDCHHNYVTEEKHFGKKVWLTRKGAIRAGAGEFGIIPGSMGVKSYIVSGLGNRDSYMSCSHGAGRAMSRTAARQKFTLEEHELATTGVECKKDDSVLDETPGAYKDIDAVMEAQKDLVEIVHELKQIVCVKG